MEKTMQDSKRDVEIEQRIGKFVRDFSIAVQDEQSVNYNILRKMLRELLASEISKAREEGRREVIHKLKEEVDMAEASKFIDAHQDFFNSFGKSMLLKISKLNN